MCENKIQALNDLKNIPPVPKLFQALIEKGNQTKDQNINPEQNHNQLQSHVQVPINKSNCQQTGEGEREPILEINQKRKNDNQGQPQGPDGLGNSIQNSKLNQEDIKLDPGQNVDSQNINPEQNHNQLQGQNKLNHQQTGEGRGEQNQNHGPTNSHTKYIYTYMKTKNQEYTDNQIPG